MPFRHVVMFKWVDGFGAEQVVAARDALNALPLEVESIRGYRHGPDVGVSEGNFDYVVVADFDDIDGWKAYRDHPQHLLLIEEHIKGNVTARAAVQYET